MPRRRRRGEYSSGGGGGIGGLIAALGGAAANTAPELTEGAESFLAPEAEGNLRADRIPPEKLYKEPGFFNRLFAPERASNIYNANSAYHESLVGSGLSSNAARAMELEDVKDLQEKNMLELVQKTRGRLSEPNQARLQQLNMKFAEKERALATARTAEEGTNLTKESVRGAKLGNDFNETVQPNKIAAETSGFDLKKLLNESQGRLIPSSEDAARVENYNRTRKASRVPLEDSPLYEQIDPETGEVIGTQEGENFKKKLEIEDFRYDRGRKNTLEDRKNEQNFIRERDKYGADAALERQQLSIEGRKKVDPLAALFAGGEGSSVVDLGDGIVAVPRAGPSAPAIAPIVNSASPVAGTPTSISREEFNSKITTPLETSSSSLKGLVPAQDPEFAGQWQPKEQLFSQRDEGFSGMLNLANPGSPNNMLNRIIGNKGMGGGDLYVNPTPDGSGMPEWYQQLTPEQKRAAVQETLRNIHTRRRASEFR